MRSLALVAVIALAGCTQSPSRYPSLLPRSIETQSLAEPDRPVAPIAADPALDARIAATMSDLDATEASFAEAAQQAEARIAVARGLPEGSEAWLDAQTALASLDAIRAPVSAALAELDQIAIDRGTAGQPPYPALQAAVARTQRLAQAQADRIGALEAALAAPNRRATD